MNTMHKALADQSLGSTVGCVSVEDFLPLSCSVVQVFDRGNDSLRVASAISRLSPVVVLCLHPPRTRM